MRYGRFAEAIGEGRGGRLVDQPLDLEARKPAGVDRGLALVIVEICRDRDDHVRHGIAEMRFCVRLE